jgi:hypothetical protein
MDTFVVWFCGVIAGAALVLIYTYVMTYLGK